jgi:adenylate cyclase
LPTLTIKAGNKEISTFEIDTSIIIGRSPDSDIQLDDSSASLTHALIDKENGDFILRDLGSTNGTFLNKKRVTESELKSGDVIMIGRHFLFFK